MLAPLVPREAGRPMIFHPSAPVPLASAGARRWGEAVPALVMLRPRPCCVKPWPCPGSHCGERGRSPSSAHQLGFQLSERPVSSRSAPASPSGYAAPASQIQQQHCPFHFLFPLSPAPALYNPRLPQIEECETPPPPAPPAGDEAFLKDGFTMNKRSWPRPTARLALWNNTTLSFKQIGRFLAARTSSRVQGIADGDVAGASRASTRSSKTS